jgi:hypothetical protein
MEDSEKDNQPQDNRSRKKIPPSKSKPKLTIKVGITLAQLAFPTASAVSKIRI